MINYKLACCTFDYIYIYDAHAVCCNLQGEMRFWCRHFSSECSIFDCLLRLFPGAARNGAKSRAKSGIFRKYVYIACVTFRTRDKQSIHSLDHNIIRGNYNVSPNSRNVVGELGFFFLLRIDSIWHTTISIRLHSILCNSWVYTAQHLCA